MLDGKYVDVDYPTAAGATRPGAVYGADAVKMFGSWTATETPDGSDLPPPMQWEGGVRGKWYDFRARAQRDWICAVSEPELPALRQIAQGMGGSLPADFCAKRQCLVDAIRSGNASGARAACRL